MTSQEVLAQALDLCGIGVIDGHPASDWSAAILDALPEGWVLGETSGDFYPAAYDDGMTDGAQQERERLRGNVRDVLSREDPKDGVPVVRVQWLVDVFLADPEPDR